MSYLLPMELMGFFYLQPPNIKSFIDSVTVVPLENVELPLKDFAWEFDKVCTVLTFLPL
jgi:hypothetical protein